MIFFNLYTVFLLIVSVNGISINVIMTIIRLQKVNVGDFFFQIYPNYTHKIYNDEEGDPDVVLPVAMDWIEERL